MLELLFEFLIAFVKTLPFYFAFVFLPGLLYSRFIRELQQHKITDGSDVFYNGVLIPYQEEVLYRYVPYFAGGVLLVVPATIIWAIAHPIVRGFQKNKKLFLASSLYYLSAGAFYIFALTQHILLPLVYHMMHNSVIEYAVYSRFKKVEKELKESKFIKVKESQEQKTKETKKIPVKVTIPFTYAYVKPTEIEINVEEPIRFTYVKAKL